MSSKKAQLLRAFESSPSDRNVVLNFRGSAETEFGPYGAGFHKAAKLLAAPLLERGVRNDLEGPPVVYMYRHALELHLKAVLLIGNRLMVLDGKGLPEADLWKLLNGHRLSVFLPQLKKIFEYMGWRDPIKYEPIKRFADIRSVVVDLEGVDPGSFSFRYPTDTQGDPSLSHHFSFNVSHFVSVMNPLIELLDNCISALEHAWENACEGLSDVD